jgi:predicted RNase H-like nuclease (RuvC/YqgF family)
MRKIVVALLLLGTSLICWAQPEDFVKEVPSGAEVWHQEEHRQERKQIEKRFRNIEKQIKQLKRTRGYRIIVKENRELREKIKKLENEVDTLKRDTQIIHGLQNNFEIRMRNVEEKSKNIENDVKRLDKQQKILQDNQENIEQNILIILLLILTLSLLLLLIVI